METSPISQLQAWIDSSRRIVFFGGAGVSTESGIPDFRSQDGLYHQQFAVPPETILSHTYFERHRRRDSDSGRSAGGTQRSSTDFIGTK